MRTWLPLLVIGIAAAHAYAQGAPGAETPAESAAPAASETPGAPEATPEPEAPSEPGEEPAPPPAPASAVREAVEAGNYFFTKHFEERDAQAIAELYTEDARVIAPGAAPAEGRAAIAAFWAGAMQGTQSVRLETLEVESAGELAFEEGVVELTAHDGTKSSERYVVVWKRVGRRWHLHRDIWNAGPPAPAVAPAGGSGSPAPEAGGTAPTAGETAPSPEPAPDAPPPEPGAT